MKQCLNCSAISEDNAERCVDCNVPLTYFKPVSGKSTKVTTPSRPAGGPAQTAIQAHSAGWLSPVGCALIIIGLLMVLYGLFASGAPQYSETLNIGLLNDKTNMVIAGGFSFTSGTTLLALAEVMTRMSLALGKRS